MKDSSHSAAQRSHYDVFIIGGGINGCGIARDAAGRGYSVCLCEAGDFASGTSSASTKLVHGGLRYLEHYEFRLVRKALLEREVLWNIAPHIIWPLRFVLPYHSGLRPGWLLRLGLFLYDHIGGRKLLPPSKSLNLSDDEAGKPLKNSFSKAFEYSDCWVDDSRLVVLNARDAADRGGDIRPRTKVNRAERVDGVWKIEIEDSLTGVTETLSANVVVNAAGPWVDEVLKSVFGRNDARNVRLVRGSHIVIKKKFAHEKAYIFQNADDRIIFAIPYERDYTLIGTTDADEGPEMGKPEITPEETGYLCNMASEYFAEPVSVDDVVWTYSGVRPLFDDGASKAQEATRDYIIRQDGGEGDAMLLNIFGGKITTYRVLANTIMDEIESTLGARQSAWTADTPLPGGAFPIAGFDALVDEYVDNNPSISRELVTRLVRLYGTRAKMVLGNDTLGVHFGHDLYAAEVSYLMRHEWACNADDVLFRRTKLGIAFSKAQRQALQDFMDNTENSSEILTINSRAEN